MSRLLVHVEGQTEEDFVNEVLRDHLLNKGYHSVGARIVGNNRLRRRRGGIRGWPSVRKDIVKHLRQDPGCIATTMVDFYGLPKHGDGAWPGRAAAIQGSTEAKASYVEEAILGDVSGTMGPHFDSRRFVPFVMMHEFEGLLFSDCEAFGRGIGQPGLSLNFRKIRDGFDSPEDINDSPHSAPSRRIEDIVPQYEKPLLGTLAVLEIGLSTIRRECPHFAAWLNKLESLAPA
jgi:Domain of unknown function (DUF4276)